LNKKRILCRDGTALDKDWKI